MRSLVALILTSTALVGCATQPAFEFPEWSRTPRNIAITGSGKMPEPVILAQKSDVSGDAASGAAAGSASFALQSILAGCAAGPAGCALGFVLAPIFAATGIAVGGAVGAAGSQPKEVVHDSSDSEHIRTALQNDPSVQNLENMLIDTMLANVDQHILHNVIFPPSTDDALLLQNLRRASIYDGLIVLKFNLVGLRHPGIFDINNPDPELAVTMRAESHLYFRVRGQIKKATFKEHTYDGKLYKVSELKADDHPTLHEELQEGIKRLSRDFLRDIFAIGLPESEEYVQQ